MDQLYEPTSKDASPFSSSDVLSFILHRHRAAVNALPPTIVIIGAAALLAVVIVCYKTYTKNKAFATFSAANNHQDPPLIPNDFPWGFLHKFKVLKFKGDFLDDFVAAKYKRYGACSLKSLLLLTET